MSLMNPGKGPRALAGVLGAGTPEVIEYCLAHEVEPRKPDDTQQVERPSVLTVSTIQETTASSISGPWHVAVIEVSTRGTLYRMKDATTFLVTGELPRDGR